MGILLVVISALCFGTSGTWVALSGDGSLSTIVLSILRLSFICAFSLLFCGIRKIDLKLSRQEMLSVVIFGCLGQGLTVFLYDSSARSISVGITALCHYTYPLLVALASAFLNYERPGKMMIIAAVLMLSGLGLTTGGGTVTITGVIYALASAVTFGTYVYALDHTLLRNMEPFKMIFYNTFFSILLLLVIGSIRGSLTISDSPRVYLCMLGAAATGFTGMTLLTRGIRIVGASKASFLSVLEPASAFIWDVVIFHTKLNPVAVLGIFLTFLSFFAVLLDKPSREKSI